MCSNQSKIINRRELKAKGKEYMESYPPVSECVSAFLEYGDYFTFAFLPSDETNDKFPEYMVEKEEEMKEEIYNVLMLGHLKFEKVVLLFEVYEAYGVRDEYLEKLSKTKGPNQKSVLWYKFLKENFTYDFRDELNYDFTELSKLIEM